MAFSLLSEVGIEHVADTGASLPFAPLHYPVFAARAEDGTTVVVDERGIEKSLPLRAWYRTLRLAPDGTVVADSADWGADDAYGFLWEQSLAVLRVTQWEIVVGADLDVPAASIDVSAFSKRMPLIASPTPHGTLLVAFADVPYEVDVIELDPLGRLLWYLPQLDRLGYPGTIQLLRNGNILVADEFCHVVLELARDGTTVHEVGRRRDPGRRDGRLSSPRAAAEAADGAWIVADTRNDRVLRVADGVIEPLAQPADGLSSPTHAVQLPDGNLLVSDAGNRRVVEYDERGEIVTQWGQSSPGRRWFSFPRSVEALPGGALLVCDTARDRVVVVENGRPSAWPVEPSTQLFWPRCARLLPSGTLLVADGRNGRVLEIAPSGEVLHRLESLQLDGGRPLEDPHDVRLLADGNLLVTDAPSGLVVETDWDGRVSRRIGGKDVPIMLRDPHSAQLLANGTVLVCDSGNHRVVWVGAAGELVRDLRALSSGPSLFRLSGPRYAEISPSGVLVIADTGNNRVLAADDSGELLWELSSVPDARLPFLNQPRWAQVSGSGEVIVCDHCHHRILRLGWAPQDTQPTAELPDLRKRIEVA